MKTSKALFTVLLLCLPLLASAREPKIYRAPLEGTVVIDTDGSVMDVTFETSLGDNFDAALTQKISRWVLQPVLSDGKPAVAVAYVSLWLQADLSSQEVRIENFRLREPPSGKRSKTDPNRPAPVYPRESSVRRFGAEIVLNVRIDENGVVKETSSESGWLTGPRTSTSERKRHFGIFVKAAESAVKKWSFPELAAEGHEVLQLPVYFVLRASGAWRPAYRVDVEPAPWVIAHQGQPIAKLDNDGELESERFRLVSGFDR
ncbi:hypothetical protein [Pseudomarimonas arenosa]|uniref:TonB C-terminal domain-containing protein n=1 Tax=Pseudomarimonas arenosa TaxID=2774145 RepID=A0AAW3ZIZ3_9GAMM|nr:hypothetical protein [Pseudomarimonas arenosa]MBD8524905.1 hypothetical protein [Pseudomarimonas arenosa]